MSTYRLTLKLRSPLGTPLTADTLFGHLCWAIVYREGEARLQQFLSEMDGPDPPLVISDPLPAGHLPMPCLPAPPADVLEALAGAVAATDPIDLHDRVRDLLRRPYIARSAWDSVAADLGLATLLRALWTNEKASRHSELAAATVPHNTVNRLTNHTSTTDETGVSSGGLFFDEILFPQSTAGQLDYDVWARSDLPENELTDLFETGLAGGYGRDGSTGKGYLTIERFERDSLPTVSNANGQMTLGTVVPGESDPGRGFWQVDVRHGKLGGAWASGADDASVFKRPVILLARGSIFINDQPAEFMGRMVHDVHPHRPEVVTCGYTLTVPVRLSEEVIQCAPTT